MSQVFISYAHVDPDRELAAKLRQQIEANGFDVWVDSKIGLGQNWVEQIDTQLRRSTHLIALLSPRSIHSDMVRREISIAYGLKKADKITILPVRVALDEELPYELGAYLDHIQYVCWRPGESLDAIFQAVLEALQGRALPARESTAATNSKLVDSKQFSWPQLDAITAQLARYLGPVARFVVDEAARKAKSREDLYSILASEIPPGEERRKFEAALRSLR